MPRKEYVTFAITFDVTYDDAIPGARKYALDELREDLRDLDRPIPVSVGGSSASFGSYGWRRLASTHIVKK